MTDTTTRRPTGEFSHPDESLMSRWPLTKEDAGYISRVTAALFVATVVTGLLIRHVASATALGRADVDTSRWFAAQRTATWNRLTDWGSAFSDTITIVVALAVVVPLLLLITRRWRGALLLAGAVAIETLVFVTASFVVGRNRPPVEQLDVSPPTASFPSGHTGAAVAFYIGLVVLVFWWTRNRVIRSIAVIVGGAIPVIVAVSRLYRGMHFTTDVLFGALVGAVSVALFTRVLGRSTESET